MNGLNRKFPIIVGISQPAYTAAQLAEFEASESAVHTFNGKEYTRFCEMSFFSKILRDDFSCF